MFSRWFRRSGGEVSPSAASLHFPRDTLEYAKFVLDMINTADPPTRAMCVVALQNLKPLLLASEDAGKKLGKPFHFDQMLEGMHGHLEEVGDDPINSRRFLWFVMAMHVTRLDQLATLDATLVNQAVALWLQLADAGRYVPRLLESNVVWKAEEKEWFETTKTEKDGMRYVVTIAMPRAYRRHARAKAFADQHDFLLLP